MNNNCTTFAPALINSKGMLISAMCCSTAGKEWGYIKVITRRSTDGGESWSEPVVAATPPAREISDDINNTKSAFFLNPVLSLAPNGDIVMAMTFFPESKGTADLKYLEKKKAAFTYFDGKNCPIVYDRDSSYYIIMENGNVIDKAKAKTAFEVKGIGELYKDGEYIGNMYLNGAKGKSVNENKTTFGSMLKAPKRSYIFVVKSSDNGLTWSEPVNITPSIFNENDGTAVMTTSGAGLTTETGRIIIPLYSEKGSFAIYSDDSGDSWSRNPRMPYIGGKGKWTAVQTPDGAIHALNEGKTVISRDNGIIWEKGEKLPNIVSKSHKSTIRHKEYLFLTAKAKKLGGSLAIADYVYDKKGNYKDIRWRKAITQINEGKLEASCLTAINDKTIGILYENENAVEFTTVNIE